ncbi:MAG: hypothetical protein ABIK10_02190 [candidate division WOR-3 bacterium]
MASKVQVATPNFTLESIPFYALNNLKNLKSFRYRYAFQGEEPNKVKGDFIGVVLYPVNEERHGELIINNRRRKILIKARGEYQYEFDRNTNNWQRQFRTDDNNILAIIERTVGNKKFYLMSKEALRDYNFEDVLNITYDESKYFYSFWPNLAFLDPTFSRRFKALVIIDKNTCYIEKIYAVDETKTIQFKIELFDHNKPIKIKFPPIYDYIIELKAAEPQTRINYREYAQVIKKRFADLEADLVIERQWSWFKTTGLRIKLIASKFLDERAIKRVLTQKGRFYALYFFEANAETLDLPSQNIREINLNENFIEVVLDSQKTQEIANLFISKPISTLQWYLDNEYIGSSDVDKVEFSGKINIFTSLSSSERKIFSAIVKNKMLHETLNIIAMKRE